MKRTLLLPALALSATMASAQLPTGSIAPDFTATDINGKSQHLYALLDSGYTVIMDISAAWCAPCWTYHRSGALKNLYNTYGPGTTQNKVRVLFVEGESTNTTAQLYGTSNGIPTDYANYSRGNWVTNTPYPIIDNASIASLYRTRYFPTAYVICPTRLVTLVGPVTGVETAAQLWPLAQACPVAIQGTNAAFLPYNDETVMCNDQVATQVRVQNMGSTTLSSISVDMKENGNTVASRSWSGTLPPYAYGNVNFPQTAVTNAADVTFEIATPDDKASDNTLDPQLISGVPATTNITFSLTLDYYCSETSWKLFNTFSGATVRSGGPYNCSTDGGGADANKLKTFNWTLPLGCYRMEVYDAGGDGLFSMYTSDPHPNGRWTMVDGNGTTLFSGGGTDQFYLSRGGLNVNTAAGISENALNNSLNVYPNPTHGDVYLSYDLEKAARVTVEVFNAQGALVLANTTNVPAGLQLKQMDMGGLDNGVYFMNITADGIRASRTIVLDR
ncbi:MAG: T9SS type A sorting domain-containing protein [Flavobacteriales bacterium]